MMRSIILVLLTATLLFTKINADYGLVYGRSAGTHDWQLHVCVTYNPNIFPLPSDRQHAVQGNLQDFSEDFGCYDSTAYDKKSADGDIVAVARGNCTFVEKTDMAEKHKAKAVIVLSDKYVLPGLNQTSDKGKLGITIASMITTDYTAIKNLGETVELMMYSPIEENKFDPCIIVIFGLAVFCIAVGGYWSGLTRINRIKAKEEKHKRKTAKKYVQSTDTSGEDNSGDEKDNDDDEIDIGIPSVIIFFVLVCTFLLLLYFFYDYLVYVIISMFCLAGSIGLFYCILPLWNYIPVHIRIPKMPCTKHQPEIKNFVLYAICAGVAIWWAVERHAGYAWVLQDILGVAFCINMLKTLQLPNLKICSILLILLFLYDIFFVFITPLFTKNGESIMVKVATGGSGKSTERLPMVFVVPKLNSIYSVCNDQPSMLGFGDVIVPGLLIGYNHGIDLIVNSRKIYYIATVIAYAIGMVITFIALELMKTGQPALLYLVPCTLITTFVIGCIRGEVRLLWNGKQESKKTEDTESSQESTNRSDTSPDHNNEDTSNTVVVNENKSLIRK